jgi:hypothetical protein
MNALKKGMAEEISTVSTNVNTAKQRRLTMKSIKKSEGYICQPKEIQKDGKEVIMARNNLMRKIKSRISWKIFILVVLVMLFGPLSHVLAQPNLITIDSFETDQAELRLTYPDDLILGTIFSIVSGPGIIGKERYTWIELTGGTIHGNFVRTEVSGGVLTYHTTDVQAKGSIRWDGSDGRFDFTGLGGVDLSAGGLQDAFLVTVGLNTAVGDLTELDFEVYRDAGSSSALSLFLPGGISGSTEFIIPFSAFHLSAGLGAGDFTDVGAITLDMSCPFTTVLEIHDISTTSMLSATLVDELFVDNDGDGQADPGDTIRYTITIENPDDAFDADATGVMYRFEADPNLTPVRCTPVPVGSDTIHDGDSLTILYDYLVNDLLPAGLTEISSQFFVSSDGLTDLPSDDPDDPTGPDDPTVTPLASPEFGPLRVSPRLVSIVAGSTADVTINGGEPDYSASSDDRAVAAATVYRNTLTITGVSEGTAIITVTDDVGDTVSIDVTVEDDRSLTVGGCGQEKEIKVKVDTTVTDRLILRLCKQTPRLLRGRLFVTIEIPDSFPGHMWCHLVDRKMPLADGSYSYIAPMRDDHLFLTGSEDLFFFEGPLSSTPSDVSLTISTDGLAGLTLVFSTRYLPEGLPLSMENLKTIQSITVDFI